MKSPNRIPHSPAQKSGLYISGDFKETGAPTPNRPLSPNLNRSWLKRTTASAPITPAAKQIAARCIRVKLFSIMIKTPFNYLSVPPVGSGLHFHDDFQFDRRTEWKARGTKDNARRDGLFAEDISKQL